MGKVVEFKRVVELSKSEYHEPVSIGFIISHAIEANIGTSGGFIVYKNAIQKYFFPKDNWKPKSSFYFDALDREGFLFAKLAAIHCSDTVYTGFKIKSQVSPYYKFKKDFEYEFEVYQINQDIQDLNKKIELLRGSK